MEKGVILLYRMSCDGSLNLHEEAHPDSPGLSRVVSFDRVLGAPGCSSLPTSENFPSPWCVLAFKLWRMTLVISEL